MQEVTGPVIAIVLVLAAVFVPVGFLGGITGQLYKQFAITIAMSVAISGLVALTLSPALAAILLKPGHGAQPGRLFRGFNRFFGWTQTRYTTRSVGAQAFGAVGCRVCGADYRGLGPLLTSFPAASCRKKIKATLSASCNCLMAPRKNARMR